MSYSQNNEEQVILEYFRPYPPGRLLDIGAYDGELFSNTLALIETGWGGVLVEPSPLPFHRMMQLHKDRMERLVLVNAVVTPGPTGWMTLHCSEDALSTIDEADRLVWAAQANFKEIVVQPMPMTDLLSITGNTYDFISIDADGVNIELFDKLPDDLLDECKLICVEHQNAIDHIVSRCAALGMFNVLLTNPENIIIGR